MDDTAVDNHEKDNTFFAEKKKKKTPLIGVANGSRSNNIIFHNLDVAFPSQNHPIETCNVKG